MPAAALRSLPTAPLGGADPVRVLLAASHLPTRLTLKAVLEKSGYLVDAAGSASEAMDKIEGGQYTLVLCDFGADAVAATQGVIRLARSQDYRPAAAALRVCGEAESLVDADRMLIAPVDVPELLTQIAELLASRASFRAQRALTHLAC